MTLYVSADRPTAEVTKALMRLERDATSPNFHVVVEEAPAPVVSASGQSWMEVLSGQYRRLLLAAPGIQAAMLWDDDALFTRSGLRSLRGLLQFLDVDRVEVESLFLWNHPDRVNVRFPPHWSACLFRVYPEDEFPTDFVVHCPRHCARSDRVVRLQSPWLNYGYMDPSDRELTWEAQKAAGKIDAHTLCLVSEPHLVDLKELSSGRK